MGCERNPKSDMEQGDRRMETNRVSAMINNTRMFRESSRTHLLRALQNVLRAPLNVDPFLLKPQKEPFKASSFLTPGLPEPIMDSLTHSPAVAIYGDGRRRRSTYQSAPTNRIKTEVTVRGSHKTPNFDIRYMVQSNAK